MRGSSFALTEARTAIFERDPPSPPADKARRLGYKAKQARCPVVQEMMSRAVKAATLLSQAGGFQLRAALFHSTPVLERKRRNFWDQRSTYSSRKSRRLHVKHSLRRDMDAFAQSIFQGWTDDLGDENPSLSEWPSWFRKQYPKGSRGNCTSNQGKRRSRRRSFEFCEDEAEPEKIFRAAFGGNRNFYWSFINDENPQWRQSSGHSNTHRTRWRRQFEDEYDSSSESEICGSDLASDRLALGLKASGPLNLEDVKRAYRVCALKWHPDRHQGSSKAIAEENFKRCGAAYTSLCDKLAAE